MHNFLLELFNSHLFMITRVSGYFIQILFSLIMKFECKRTLLF